MAKKKTAPKKSKKRKPAPKKAKAKAKSSAAVKAKKPAPAKAKVVAKSKIVAKGKAAAEGDWQSRRKASGREDDNRKGRTGAATWSERLRHGFRANQEVEIVRPKGRSRVARAGAGSGDLQGISTVEEADSESEDELLEEGQSFEAGIIYGVERAGDE